MTADRDSDAPVSDEERRRLRAVLAESAPAVSFALAAPGQSPPSLQQVAAVARALYVATRCEFDEEALGLLLDALRLLATATPPQDPADPPLDDLELGACLVVDNQAIYARLKRLDLFNL